MNHRDRKPFNVTVIVRREYSATITIAARTQAEAEEIALGKYWDFACGRDGNMGAYSLGFPPTWDEHESVTYDPEIDTIFHCIDCGACTSSLGQYYMVSDDLWAASGVAPDGGMLCLHCLERRIGRKLILDDFTAMGPRREAWEHHVASRRRRIHRQGRRAASPQTEQLTISLADNPARRVR
jgi:hypothetical protein